MSTMTCMRGYPGSGKSTIAYSLAAQNNAVVVNRDLLRKMGWDSYYGGRIDEDTVTLLERAAVTALLEQGKDVIIDAMHIDPRYPRAWAKLAARYGYDFAMHDVRLHPDACVYRDQLRLEAGDRAVGDTVIRRLAQKFPMEKWPEIPPYGPTVEPYTPPRWGNYKYPDAIIVDLDGTLYHNTGGRSPYDYSRVFEDTVDEDIRAIVQYHYDKGDEVILCSGRDDACEEDTRRALRRDEVAFDQLYMRPTVKGPKDPDWVIKLQIFNKRIRDQYNVRLVLDDRDQVVQLWRRLGLKCWQVADGNF